MGRTFRTPILKLEVNCTAAISKEKVSCTAVCIVAAGCGLATVAGEGLFAGAVGISVVSGMVAGVVVCGNTGLVEIAAGKLDAGPVTALAAEDLIAPKVGSYETGCFCSIGSTSPFGAAFASAGRTTFVPVGISFGSSVVITESSADSRVAETSAISGVCGLPSRELSAVCSMTRPTDDSKIGSSGTIEGGPVNASIAETSAISGVCETPGRKLSAVCSTTASADDSKIGLASGNSGTLGRNVSAICSTTGLTDDSKTGSVTGFNSRSGSPLWYAGVCDALPTTSTGWSGAPLGFAEGRTVRPNEGFDAINRSETRRGPPKK